MPNLEHTLERLASTFTAKDIMMPKEKLVCASDKVEALKLLEEHPDYDVIPIVQAGTWSAYFERGSDQPKPIRLQHVISDATSILDIVNILQDRKFCFVLVRDSIEGYIHFSDLNKPSVKVPYFIILEDLERRLVEQVGPLINEHNLGDVLSTQRTEFVKKKMCRQGKNRAELQWVNLLLFDEIVRFGCHLGKVRLKPAQIEHLSKTRNSVCHAANPLIESHKDVRRLARVKSICNQLFKDMTANDEHSPGGAVAANTCLVQVEKA